MVIQYPGLNPQSDRNWAKALNDFTQGLKGVVDGALGSRRAAKLVAKAGEETGTPATGSVAAPAGEGKAPIPQNPGPGSIA